MSVKLATIEMIKVVAKALGELNERVNIFIPWIKCP